MHAHARTRSLGEQLSCGPARPLIFVSPDTADDAIDDGIYDDVGDDSGSIGAFSSSMVSGGGGGE
jgi:hypothetical protein